MGFNSAFKGLIMFAYIASNVTRMDDSLGKNVEGCNRDQMFGIVPASVLRKLRNYKH